MLAQRPPLPEIVAGPAVFAGDDACLTIALLAGLRGLSPDRPLLVVDGANAFDPFLVSDLARRSGAAPAELLERVRISRVFTCHQLEALLRGRLQAAVAQFHAGAVYFSGPLDPLLDEDVAAGEARRIFRLLPPVLRRLSAGGIVTVCACPPPLTMPGRDELFPALCATARWVFTVERAGSPGRGTASGLQRGGAGDGIRIICTKPSPGQWVWHPQIGLAVPRRWW